MSDGTHKPKSLLGVSSRLMEDPETTASLIFGGLEESKVRFPETHAKVIGKLIEAGYASRPRAFL